MSTSPAGRPEYDPEVAADHTGMAFRHTPGREKRGAFALFRNPKLVTCPHDGSEVYRFFADDDDKSGLMLIQCPKCSRYSLPWEARKPQADDHRMKSMGLVMPNHMIIDEEMEFGR